MFNDKFYYVEKNNTDKLVISVTHSYSRKIKMSDSKIHNLFSSFPFTFKSRKNKYNWDWLFIQDPYDCYYVCGYNMEDKSNTIYSYIDFIIKFLEKNNYKKVFMIGHSMGGYFALFCLLNSVLKNLVTCIYVTSPQTDILSEKNFYMYRPQYTCIRRNKIIKSINEKYEGDQGLFNLKTSLNDYDGSGLIIIYVHNNNALDASFVRDIINNKIIVNKRNEKTIYNHNTLVLSMEEIFDEIDYYGIE